MFYFSRQVFLRWIAVIVLLLFVTETVSAQLTFNTILHDSQVNQVPDELAYQVDLYASVLDGNNVPIKNLQQDNFIILQDSQPISFTLSEAPSQAMSLVLVIDTSGSMSGVGIQNARQAVQLFVQQLGVEDNVAVITFNNKVGMVSDFSLDRSTLLRQVDSIEAVPNAGTCLYDALYQAVQMSSLAPQGRRAILVMTDGKDELSNGKVCSSANIDDVINTAANNIDTPIYSIGVGKELDENGLQRLALLTGGSFQKSNDFKELGPMFENMQVQLKNQYLLSFISKAPPGDHSVTVKTVIGSNSDTDMRQIRLPDLGPMIKIVSPKNGGILDISTPLQVEFLGKTDNVAKVRYEISGEVLGEVSSPPFELRLNTVLLPDQEAKLTASALDADGKVISSYTIDFVVPMITETVVSQAENNIEPQSLTTEVVENRSEPTMTGQNSKTKQIIIIVVSVASLLLVALLLLIVKPFHRSKPASAAVSPMINDATSESTYDSALPMMGMHGQTNGSAILTVVFSDDRTRIGEKIVIQQAITHIGRSSNNDIVFSKDHPVSRRHAVLEYKDGLFQISEALTGDESGMKAPTFGTFVNDENLGGAPAILHNGDEIRLGNRLRLRFESFNQLIEDNPLVTLDQ